jgi:DivIVA domain-containing protein
MELTLKRLLEHAEFKKYRGKGYDPTEVDDFLDRAAAMAGKVEVQLTQALEAAKAAEASGGAAGSPAAPDPAAVEAEVDKRVAARLAELETDRSASLEGEAEQSSRILLMAQRTADDTVAAAQTEADALVAAAREQAGATVAEAQAAAAAMRSEAEELLASTRAEVEAEAARERREARQRLAAEITELEGVREALRSDVNVLERHVEEQRSQLGSTLAELQQILDDPSGFRMAPPPALVDPVLPDLSDVTAPEAEAEAAAEEPDAEPSNPAEVAAPADAAPAEDAGPSELADAVDADAAPAGEPTAEETGAGFDDGPEAPNAFDLGPSPQALDFGGVDHAAPGVDDPTEVGPPTAPVSAVDLGVSQEPTADPDDDPFLTELRKAMDDDVPLGPRDQEGVPDGDTLFADEDRRGWRFGRRR